MIYKSNLFYDEYAKFYDKYLQKRKKYHHTIDRMIIKNLGSSGDIKLIDLGCGNGKRSARIAKKCNILDITFVDDSSEMLNLSKRFMNNKFYFISISSKKFKISKKMDIALCLANVLGHMDNKKERLLALQNINKSLKSGGTLYIDVNNRYNISAYGIKAVFKNYIKDLCWNSDINGDYLATIPYVKSEISTKVHLFTSSEIEHLLTSEGFKIINKYSINYTTGKIEKFTFNGQLFYEVKKP